jgi:hypothetical protein
VEARRDQQIEVEKFVEREFSRQEEYQKPWPFSILSKKINQFNDEFNNDNNNFFGDNNTTNTNNENKQQQQQQHPFYSMKNFKLRHHEALGFPDNLFISSNFFNPNWTGLRRIKNVVMVFLFSFFFNVLIYYYCN